MSAMNQNLMSLLTETGRKVTYSYKLLDYQDVEKNIELDVIKSTITYSSLDDIKQTAEITMIDNTNIDYVNDRIKIICNIKTSIGVFSYPLGVFIISAPRKSITESNDTRNMRLYCKLKILYDEKLEEPLRLGKGANIRNAIIALLGTHMYDIPSSTSVLDTDKEFEIGRPKLGVINELLGLLGFTSLCANGDGYFISAEYVLPVDRQVELSYTNDKYFALQPQMDEDLDLFDIPNVFISYTTGPDNESLYYKYENNNSESKTSIISRKGRRVTEQPVQVEVTGTTTANKMAEIENATKKRAAEASGVYAKLTFYTMVLPIHDYLNCLYVKTDKINDKFIETSWTIDTKNDKMTHNCRKAVNI